jgi:hypothetical protein
MYANKYSENAFVPGLAGVLEGDAKCELLEQDTIGNTSGHKELIVCAVNSIAFDENKEATFTPRHSCSPKKKKKKKKKDTGRPLSREH